MSGVSEGGAGRRRHGSGGRTLVRGGRLVDPSQDLDGRYDLLIEDGRVARIDGTIEPRDGDLVVEAAGLVVAPGLIDMHVHLREPGHEYKETVRTGTLSAAAGGFTAVACMANTEPVNDNRSVTEHILTEARRHGFARVYPIGAISKGLKGEELSEVGELVEAGAVALSDDGRPVSNAELMRRVLLYSQQFGVRVIQHAQDLDLTAGGVMHEGEVSACCGMAGIPGAAEDVMVARDLILLEDNGGKYHVAHLSTARSLDLVRQARQRGLDVTCEVTPHHLLLTERVVSESGFSGDAKMNPPLRSSRDCEALIQGLCDGTVDAVATDHAPHHPDEKLRSFQDSPFGIVGLETSLALCLDRLVHPGLVSLRRVIELLSCGPARALGVAGGTLRVGAVGDVTLFDPERSTTVDPSRLRSKSRNTPFAGWTLRGSATGTLLGGRPIELP